MFELERVINSQYCCFQFPKRSLPSFLKEHIVLKPKEQKLIKVKAPFFDEISGLAIIKILDGSTYSIMLIKLKFTHNEAILDMVKNGTETIIFKPEEMLGIIDLRSLGYYKIKQGILKEPEENYPWLDPSVERKYMTDQEILDKYIDLEKSCLTKGAKKEVMEM